MSPLVVLNEIAASASARLVDCEGCTTCCEHGGLVYVRAEEVAQLEGLGVPLITLEGVAFIRRLADGSCPMLDKPGRRCSIYEERPLCCRLFPMDVLATRAGLAWSLSQQCPSDRRHYENTQGRSAGLGLASIARIASSVNCALTEDDRRFFEAKEKVSSRVEIVEETAASWTSLADCESAR